jgi:hypothetical protein
MNLLQPLAVATKKITRTKHLILEFTRLVGNSDQTYFSADTQKSRWAIFTDHLWWVIKNRELHRYYYVYGLDQKQKKADDIIGYKRFRRLRNAANLRPTGVDFNYACLLRDKFVFGQFLKGLGFATPRNIALLDEHGIRHLDTNKQESFTHFLYNLDHPINGFCKKLRGIRGEGAFPLYIEKGRLRSNDKELLVAELKKKICGTYLLQERIRQHPGMARIHPASINTIRLITFNNDGNVELFFAAVRFGTDNRSVDNWNAGGIAVAIDLATGRLREHGIQKWSYGKRAGRHPDTNILFSGYEVPCFKESVELVRNVHGYMYGIHSIGWDVAITETGPTLIEANEDWDGSFAMCSEEHFKQKFLRMFKTPHRNK